jgi:DNA-binding transcriptional regulator YiaG
MPVAKLPEPSERKRLREAFGINQTTLAASLKVDRKTIARWEAGTSEPTGANRTEYAAILHAWTETERSQATDNT